MTFKEERIFSLAILLTCFNRKQKTLECLEAIYDQSCISDIKLKVYLVDDGSTDGTSEAVGKNYPSANLIQGDGQLFWTGGMNLAFSKAVKDGHDFYLWLNDDTKLYPTALRTLLNTYKQKLQGAEQLSMIVGSTQDAESGQLTYGGVMKGSWFHPCRFHWVTPSQEAQSCDTMNGNCVLIPHEVVKVLGQLDTTFRHYGADFDYGLRAKRKGCVIWVAPNYIGSCEYNDPQLRTELSTIKVQFKSLKNPKGLAAGNVILHPFWEWNEFTKRHAGILWPVYWLIPYRRLLFSHIESFFKKLGKSKC